MNKKIKKLIPGFVLKLYHFSMPLLGAIIYRFPSRKIKVIGITGTNGKSTTVEIVSTMLKNSGYRVAVVSSIKFEIDGRSELNMLKMTMPGRLTIQKMLRRAVNAGCDYFVLEVTSEGIKQYRHLFINFDTAIFTNLSPEHIESHGGFNNYKNAKGDLFRKTRKNHIINLDDEHKDFFLEFPAKRKTGYGFNFNEENFKEIETIKGSDIKATTQNISFFVDGVEIKINLIGSFNAYNVLAAVSFGLIEGIDINTIKKAIEKTETVEGRMQEVVSSPFKVFVDYAFTPNALTKVYESIKKDFNPPKMICVLGACGGGRDKWKRPVLGEIAEKFCNKIIVTNEDPYDEKPLDIINNVADGTKGKAIKIIDREEAVREALKSAEENDVVVITGKGCEPWICIENGKKIPWNEKEVILNEFNKLKK